MQFLGRPSCTLCSNASQAPHCCPVPPSCPYWHSSCGNPEQQTETLSSSLMFSPLLSLTHHFFPQVLQFCNTTFNVLNHGRRTAPKSFQLPPVPTSAATKGELEPSASITQCTDIQGGKKTGSATLQWYSNTDSMCKGRAGEDYRNSCNICSSSPCMWSLLTVLLLPLIARLEWLPGKGSRDSLVAWQYLITLPLIGFRLLL